MSKNYYETLGVSKNATEDEIKKAYRKIAKQYHPDRYANKDESEKKAAEEKFKEATEAYEVLTDPEKKSKYDQFGSVDFDSEMGFNPFEDLFRGFRSSRTRQSYAVKGSDIKKTINITIKEAILGCKKSIQAIKKTSCSKCSGTGAKEYKTCPNCNGTGMKVIFSTFMMQQSTCYECSGTGKIMSGKCPDCKGNGYSAESKVIELTIPSWLDPSRLFRIAEFGNNGKNGGKNGDMYVECNILPDETFTYNPNAIYATIKVPFAKMLLGKTYNITTPLNEIVSIDIPKLSADNTELILKNAINGKPLVCKLEYLLPNKLSTELESLLEKVNELQDKEK